jgi:8-oxo-dGTP diphosphatase
MGREMAREPVLAAGGIVLWQEETPLIAVVRLRKRNEWVLPKGKLDDGETPRDAAEREVLEETGHEVSVHEFLGTLVYESGGRSKVVHYWRMETNGERAYELMDDVKAVDWLPRRPKARPAVSEKRRSRPAITPPASLTPQPDLTPAMTGPDERPVVTSDAGRAGISVPATGFVAAEPSVDAEFTTPAVWPEPGDDDAASADRGRRRNLVQKVSDWLRRAAGRERSSALMRRP